MNSVLGRSPYQLLWDCLSSSELLYAFVTWTGCLALYTQYSLNESPLFEHYFF